MTRDKNLCWKCHKENHKDMAEEKYERVFVKHWESGFTFCGWILNSVEDEPPENCPFILEYMLMEQAHA